jgi:4-amino-4-deoxy-L-arabinose transferase-like glycosyltransferase
MDRVLASPPDAAGGARPRRAGRREALALAAIVLLALVLRTVRWQQNAVLFNDGPLFLELARVLQAGDLRLALAHPYHPLYAALIAALGPVAGSLERAGAALSIAGGSAAVLALWAFLRPAFGARAAWIGALLLAVHPRAVEYSGDVQSDGLYLALFLGSLACLWRALVRGSLPSAAASGALAGLAYLTRPEGLGLVLVAGVLGARQIGTRAWRLPQLTRFGVALALGLAFTSSPYLLALRAQTGEWRISQKKELGHLAGVEEYRGPVLGSAPPRPGAAPPGGRGAPDAERAAARAVPPWEEPSLGAARGPDRRDRAGGPARVAQELRDFGRNVSSTLRRGALAFLLAGCWAAWGRPGPRGRFVLAVVGVFALVTLAHQWNVGYLSRRHLLPPLIVTFGYAALGVDALGALAARLLARTRLRSAPAAASAALLAVVALSNGAKALRPERADALAERRAAEWVRAHDSEPGFVAAPRRRVAYYAGARWAALPRRLEAVTFEEMRRVGVRYVILDDAKRPEYAGLAEAEATRLRLVHRAEAGGRSASVWEVTPGEARSRASAPAPSEG